MHMHINETRADDLPTYGNSTGCFYFREVTDVGNLVTLNADIGNKGFPFTRPVNDVPRPAIIVSNLIFLIFLAVRSDRFYI